MANQFMTLADQAKTTDPSGKALTIVEYITSANELEDIPSIPSNSDTEMIGTRRIGLPAVSRREINEGVPFTKSKTEQFKERIVLYEAQGAIDSDFIDLAADKAAARLSENSGHMQALGKIFAEDVMYGTAAKKTFTGFCEYYNSKKNSQVIDAGGTTNLRSIVIVGWSPETITSFYPKNSKAGIDHIPFDKDFVPSPDGNGQMVAYADVFKWKVGLSIKNPKFASRIANIDIKNISRAEIFPLLIKGKNQIESLKIVKPRIYCCNEIFTLLEIAAFEKANVALTYREVSGSTPIISFGGCELRRMDAMNIDENKVA
jgi:hypothetical protein